MAEDFEELMVSINASKAAIGAAQVNGYLKSIGASAAATARVMEDELARKAVGAVAASAARMAAAQERAAKQATSAIQKAAREQTAAVEKAGRDQEAAAKKAASVATAEARKSANEQKKAMKETESGAHSLRNALLAAATGTVATSVVRTIASYEGLKASLITATKSASGAEVAFKDLQGFADKTPYTLEQATKAYIRMSSAGLKPSIAALTDFGDIASAIPGKDILDFVEAVADGTQGQGRRLKEFGIDLDVQGENVKLRYGDMTQVVKNDSKTIEDALRKIAQANFGGSMERQSKTVGGLWSTLEDKAAALAAEIGEGGLLQAMKDVVVELTSTAVGAKSTAKEIGETLATGVKTTAAVVGFLVDNIKTLTSVLAGVAAYKAAASIATMATSIQAATAAAGGFRAAMLAVNLSNPFGWIAIAVSGLVALKMYLGEVEVAGAELSPPDWQELYVSPAEEAIDAIIRLREEAAYVQANPGGTQFSYDERKKMVELTKQGITIFLQSKDAIFAHAASLRDEAAAAEKAAFWLEEAKEAATYKPKNYATIAEYGKSNILPTPKEDPFAVAIGDFGKKKKGGGGSKSSAAAQVDELAESLKDLKSEASHASDWLAIVAGSPSDTKALEIQNKLLEWRTGQIEAKTSAEKIAVASGQALADITREVNAAYATQHIKDYTEALSSLTAEVGNASEILGLTQAGASARDLEIATKMQGLTAGKDYSAAEVAQLKEKVAATVDLAAATKKLNDDEKSAQDAKKQAATDAADAAKDAAKAIEEAEAASLERRKDMQNEWIDFASSGIDSFADTLTAALDGQEHAWRDFFIQLAAQAAQLALTQGFGGEASAGGGGGGLLASVLHGGGMVGSGGSYRSVSPSTFIGAPRYHSGGYAGLKADEIPAILQRGERVQSKREVANGGLRGRSSRNYSINLNLSGVTDGNGFNRALPTLLRKLRQITREDGDD